jgi:hypothetical protein
MPKDLKERIEHCAKSRKETISEYITRSMAVITQFKSNI